MGQGQEKRAEEVVDGTLPLAPGIPAERAFDAVLAVEAGAL